MRKKIYTYEKCKEIVSQYSSKKDLINHLYMLLFLKTNGKIYLNSTKKKKIIK